jgi:hypothetical protein
MDSLPDIDRSVRLEGELVWIGRPVGTEYRP